jgi:ribonucleoside-diphosphate reductase beta chain
MKTFLACENQEPNYALFPLQYPWAWDSYKLMIANFWTPEEIPMGPDVAVWREGQLTEEEQHLFLTVFAQLTTFDLLRTVDLNRTLLNKLHAPELIHVLTTQAFQECLHTHSYQYIIESLGLDQNDIYTRYKRVPALANRVSLTEKMGKLDLDDPANLFRAMAHGFLMFENCWFLTNLFGPVQSLARRGLLTATAEQFQLIGRDEQTHVALGLHLLRTMLKEHPEIWTDELQAQIIEDTREGIRLEDEFIDYALPRQILSYNAAGHKQLARYYAERGVNRIGLTLGEQAENPFPWIDEMLGHKKEKNFFETRVTEYRVGGLTWDDDDG